MSDSKRGWSKFLAETKTEFKRLGTQGSMELANALFNGSAFVPYGPGQYTPSPGKEKGTKEQAAVEPQKQNEGMEM